MSTSSRDPAVGSLQGRPAFALSLAQLHPERRATGDVITADAATLVGALERHDGVTFVLQTVARPAGSDGPGQLEVAFIVLLPEDTPAERAAAMAAEVADDVLDLLAAPPVRWSFDAVREQDRLRAVLEPFAAHSVAQLMRRESPCVPSEWRNTGGFGSPPGERYARRDVWSLWTFGQPSPDQRRMASILLAQEAPVAVRVSLTPTALTGDERDRLERLVMASEPHAAAGPDTLLRRSLRTLEALLSVQPLYDVRCYVASPQPLSVGMLSALGNTVSPPTRHESANGVLSGGFDFEVPSGPRGRATLRAAFAAPGRAAPPGGLAPRPLRRLRVLLGAWEAANLFRIPVSGGAEFPGLRLARVPDLEPPLGELSAEGVRLGDTVGNDAIPVRSPAADRMRHTYVVGQTGSGKSTLLMNLALQDIAAGSGVAVIDPHGDLVQSLLERIPADRVDDVILVDPADPVAVVGVNLLDAESPVQRQYVVEELAAMFYALFDPYRIGIVGPRFESMLRQAANLLMAQDEVPATFLDVSTLFVDTAVREHLVRQVRDPILAEFWLGEMSMSRSNEWQEVVSWFRAKFEIFRTSRLVRNVLGQARSTVSFSELMDTGKILLVNLSKGLLGEYNSALIGHIVFARIWAAALERAKLPPHDRRPFYVYVDEFQNVTNHSLPDVLSEARKFGVGLVLANQFFSQVPEGTRDAIMGNVASRVAFRLGPKDAALFSAWMGGVDEESVTRLPDHHAIASLGSGGVPLPPFPLRTLPPPPPGNAGRSEEVRERSRKQWATPVDGLDDAFFSRWAGIPNSISQRALRRAAAPTAEERAVASSGSPLLDEWLEERSGASPRDPLPPMQTARVTALEVVRRVCDAYHEDVTSFAEAVRHEGRHKGLSARRRELRLRHEHLGEWAAVAEALGSATTAELLRSLPSPADAVDGDEADP